MNKKCKIITFHNAINYGAVLQAFALKKVMNRFCEATVYNYFNERMKKQYSINPFTSLNINLILKRLLKLGSRYKQRRHFHGFVNDYLVNDQFDTDDVFYITGSDQVWNYNCTDFDKTFFLDFVKDNKLKNSYSASFGFDNIPQKYEEEYKRLLSDYNLISVRENEGGRIIKDLLDRDVPITLDPTLLLTKFDWENAFPKEELKFKQYILVYAFSITDNMRNFILKLAREKALPIVILMPEKPLNKRAVVDGAVYESAVSPEKWINYFLNASYVVTNSFHGTAFSVNFNKQFFVEYLSSTQNLNSRINTLLGNVKLMDRIISDDIDISKDIEFSKVNLILDEKRKESMDYLKSIVDSYNE